VNSDDELLNLFARFAAQNAPVFSIINRP